MSNPFRSQDKQTMTQPKRNLWRRPLTWLLLPCAAFAIIVGWVALREVRAAQAVRHEIQRLRTAGVPVDNASAESHFAAQTNKEGTHAWAEAIALLSNQWIGSLGAELPYVGTGSLPSQIDPETTWELESQVGEYLAKVQPAIDKIHATADYPKPVWQPVYFNGYSTLLGQVQASRTLVRVLLLDTEYALHTQETARALRDLESLQAVADAYDWDLFAVSKWVALASQESRRDLMRRSLAANVWSAADIEKLRDMVGLPEPVETIWPKLIESERCMLLETMRDLGEFSAMYGDEGTVLQVLFSLPSVQQRMLEQAADWEGIASGGLKEMLKRSERFEEEYRANAEGVLPSLDYIFSVGSWYPNVVQSFKFGEDKRRFTLVGIALKQFQLENGHFPERLSQLESMDLGPSDLTTIDAGAFGYRIVDDAAYVWSYIAGKETRVPTELPELSGQDYSASELGPTTHVIVVR